MRSVEDMYEVVLEKDRKYHRKQRRLLGAAVAVVLLVGVAAIVARRTTATERVVDTANTAAAVGVSGSSTPSTATTPLAVADSTVAPGSQVPPPTESTVLSTSSVAAAPTSSSPGPSASTTQPATTTKPSVTATATTSPLPEETSVPKPTTSTTPAETTSTVAPVPDCDAGDVFVDVAPFEQLEVGSGGTLEWMVTPQHVWTHSCLGPALNTMWLTIVNSEGVVVLEERSQQGYDPRRVYGMYQPFEAGRRSFWDTTCATRSSTTIKCTPGTPGTYTLTAATFGGVSTPQKVTIVAP
jgi:hypothetical protein